MTEVAKAVKNLKAAGVTAKEAKEMTPQERVEKAGDVDHLSAQAAIRHLD